MDPNRYLRIRLLQHPKRTVTMRLDADLPGRFRSNRGYQTHVNAVLRAYSERAGSVLAWRDASHLPHKGQ